MRDKRRGRSWRGEEGGGVSKEDEDEEDDVELLHTSRCSSDPFMGRSAFNPFTFRFKFLKIHEHQHFFNFYCVFMAHCLFAPSPEDAQCPMRPHFRLAFVQKGHF